MKRLQNIIASVFIIASVSSCTKVIDVNLEETPAMVVIEGSVTNDSSIWVRVTRSIDVDRDNYFPGITGAVVNITDNLGNTEQLEQSSQGVYYAYNLQGVPGRTYTLNVTVDGQTYTATSTMPQQVPVDSLTIREFNFGETVRFVAVNYTDPAEPGNNYRARLWVNDTLISEIFVEDDKYINGNPSDFTLFSPDYELKTGDKAVVEFHCIDRPVYEYFNVLQEVDGSSELASPANPQGNISNGALGYFSAHTSETRELVID